MTYPSEIVKVKKSLIYSMIPDQTLRKKSSYGEEPMQRIIIGIAGGSAAGKTTLCQNINRQMAFDRNFKVQIISLDCFYRSIDKKTVDVTEYNFDHPNALDFDKAYETLLAMKEGKQKVEIPQYSFTEHRRLQATTRLSPANIIFFQGLMAFYDKRIRDLMTYKIFIHCDDDIRLCRRLKRDTTERGRSVISVLHQYNKFVKKAFRDFIYPSIIYADLIIPGFRNNRVSVDFIVQHIKNIARHITFKEKVRKTKIYCFGENEFYDLEYHSDTAYESQITIEQSSFLVFPTSEQHKRQLQFFLSTLLSESFGYDYYQEIYLFQFVKILKSLMKQLITLKGYNLEELELLSIYNINDVFKMPLGKRRIKAILIPSALYPQSKGLLKILKQYSKQYPKTEIILLNIFGDMSFPSSVYQLQMPGTILINLYVITNQKRFREIMIGNAQFVDHSFNWLMSNRQLTELTLKNISEGLKLHLALTPSFRLERYEFAIKTQEVSKDQPFKANTLQKQITVGNITQLPTYPQEHENLCGYHTLNAIITPFEKLTDKQNFVQNYYKFKELLIPIYSVKQYLKTSDFQPLERKDLLTILKSPNVDVHHNLFVGKDISCIFYGFGYIQNSDQQLKEFSEMMKKLIDKKIKEMYVIMGVIDHYFLLLLKNNHIWFIDSVNNNLEEIMKVDVSIVKHADKKQRKLRGFRQAIQIVEDVYLHNKSIYNISAEMKIQQIIGSFNLIAHDDKKSHVLWFQEEYRPQVIRSDLFGSLKNITLKSLSEKSQNILKEWMKNQFVQSVMGEMNLSWD